MTEFRDWIKAAILIGLLGLTSACDVSDHLDENINRPNETVVTVPEAETPVVTEPAELPEPVQEKLDLIRETLEQDSIRALVRLAEQEPDFKSNYGGLNHYDHWYIMKRAGLDPIEKTLIILDEPYGVKDFGVHKFYIWPEMATRPLEELKLNRLSFEDRTTLARLVSEDGIKRLEDGEPYPGFRLAIREDGSWAYLMQDN